ncbi:MAG: bifunctional precorrin-2 dehydrogenase/sirohydrochlorin ferrochelatase [Methanobrevibacter sp.]|jgi:precorrin-2 dehydrogenase/sirohydrochlorin ferrochelatase|nr:bifunctional precorrin-2 dehydrogenase/sirohydrochlorin ferrochelatase [Methanobrevibacter sp.]
MNWTPLYFNTSNKKVFILGSGEVGFRRAKRFLESKCEVIIVGNQLPKELSEKGAILKEFDLKKDIEDIDDEKLDELKSLVDWADIVVVASVNSQLNENLSKYSKNNKNNKNKLLNRADYPEKGDIIVPTKFSIEDIEISIFTNGKSPLMARELRKKISKAITNEDILQIKLQDFVRNILKKKVSSQKDRKKILYEILNNEDIKNLLKNNELEKAKEYIKEKKLIDETN